MKFAPIGIGAAMAVTVSHSGIRVLRNLGMLVGTLYGALVVFALVALLPAALIARIPLRRFIQAVKDPAIIAFTTTSSDAALPLAMQRMTEFGVPRRIVAFVMPTGYSFNLDGSTLYLGVASIFVAQAAGVTLTRRTAAVHDADAADHQQGYRGGSACISGGAVGNAHGIRPPLEGVAVILGVDELMDMARTMVNLIGNCLATAVMARWEGELSFSTAPAAVPVPAAAAVASERIQA